jgi:probable rRNA maturation factor
MRSIVIANRHPRLRLDRRAVRRVIHTLDAHAALFRPKTARPVDRQSKIAIPSAATSVHRKSKIPPGPPPGELSLVFLTAAALAKLHADFLGDPSPTDVITFAGDPALGFAGEICVSADAAHRHVNSFVVPASAGIRQTPAKAGTTSTGPLHDNFSAELILYVVHGWLHLAGYDDLVLAKKRAMRRAEARALALLRAARVMPQFTLHR